MNKKALPITNFFETRLQDGFVAILFPIEPRQWVTIQVEAKSAYRVFILRPRFGALVRWYADPGISWFIVKFGQII